MGYGAITTIRFLTLLRCFHADCKAWCQVTNRVVSDDASVSVRKSSCSAYFHLLRLPSLVEPPPKKTWKQVEKPMGKKKQHPNIIKHHWHSGHSNGSFKVTSPAVFWIMPPPTPDVWWNAGPKFKNLATQSLQLISCWRFFDGMDLELLRKCVTAKPFYRVIYWSNHTSRWFHASDAISICQSDTTQAMQNASPTGTLHCGSQGVLLFFPLNRIEQCLKHLTGCCTVAPIGWFLALTHIGVM